MRGSGQVGTMLSRLALDRWRCVVAIRGARVLEISVAMTTRYWATVDPAQAVVD